MIADREAQQQPLLQVARLPDRGPESAARGGGRGHRGLGFVLRRLAHRSRNPGIGPSYGQQGISGLRSGYMDNSKTGGRNACYYRRHTHVAPGAPGRPSRHRASGPIDHHRARGATRARDSRWSGRSPGSAPPRWIPLCTWTRWVRWNISRASPGAPIGTRTVDSKPSPT